MGEVWSNETKQFSTCDLPGAMGGVPGVWRTGCLTVGDWSQPTCAAARRHVVGSGLLTGSCHSCQEQWSKESPPVRRSALLEIPLESSLRRSHLKRTSSASFWTGRLGLQVGAGGEGCTGEWRRKSAALGTTLCPPGCPGRLTGTPVILRPDSVTKQVGKEATFGRSPCHRCKTGNLSRKKPNLVSKVA